MGAQTMPTDQMMQDIHSMTEDEQEIVDQLNLHLLDGPANTSLLEPPETTLTNESKWSYRGRFMAGKEKEYEQTLAAYKKIANGKSCNHVHALQGCRTFAMLKRDLVTGDVKVFGDSCRDRWCPMCAGQKAAYAKDQTEIFVKSLTAPRFLTLTLRHNENSLREQITFLQRSFSVLRTRAFWKRNVTGGIWFLQVKRGKNSGLWHPHLHILLDGNYLEQGELSELWDQVTFGSPVIDIRRINDVAAAASYVSRYTARPAKLSEMPIDDCAEVIEALFRKRLCGTFGTAKTVTLTPPKIEADGEWNLIGGYDDIVKKAETCPKAKAILIAYNTYQPLSESEFQDFTGHPVGYISEFSEPKKPNPQLLLDFYNT
jgi:hypothetical protein